MGFGPATYYVREEQGKTLQISAPLNGGLELRYPRCCFKPSLRRIEMFAFFVVLQKFLSILLLIVECKIKFVTFPAASPLAGGHCMCFLLIDSDIFGENGDFIHCNQ